MRQLSNLLNIKIIGRMLKMSSDNCGAEKGTQEGTQPKPNIHEEEFKKKAAIKIQSIFLMLSPRKRFLTYIKEKGNYLAATMIQKHIRGFLCRKKLLPLITEIKKDLSSLKTRSDLGTSHFEIKTGKFKGQSPDYYGNNFDKIFACDKDDEDELRPLEPRILSGSKRFAKKGQLDAAKREAKSKGKRSRSTKRRQLQVDQGLEL